MSYKSVTYSGFDLIIPMYNLIITKFCIGMVKNK